MITKKVVYRGKIIEVPRSHANRLVFSGRASWPKEQEQQMKAEEPVQEKQEISQTTGKPKRQYRRRDMQAEK